MFREKVCTSHYNLLYCDNRLQQIHFVNMQFYSFAGLNFCSLNDIHVNWFLHIANLMY